MIDPAFFGRAVVPLAGQRRSPGMVVARVASAVWPSYERLRDGRYLETHWMYNRCCNPMEVGNRTVYVVDDFGTLVAVECRGSAAW